MESDFSANRIRLCALPHDSWSRHITEDKRFLQTITAAMKAPVLMPDGRVPQWYLQEDIRHRHPQFSPHLQIFFPNSDHVHHIRRKPVLKDNTGALKLWLVQHKKNPYPNKPEKVMLAILSRMTLTQVSTWFANARRRLKKEFPEDDFDILTDSFQNK